MSGTFTIARLFGIAIRLHFSWLFILFLVAWSLASSYLPEAFPGWPQQTYWAIGIAGGAVLFLSVLLHEMSHSLVALSRGYRARAITLFLLGGVSEMEKEANRPSEEFWIAFSGPLASLLLAGTAWGVYILVGPAGNPQARALTFFLSTINLVLGVFNLVPGFPMDGGRVLRSIVWKATGSIRRATVVAANVGMGVGLLFIGVGIILAFTENFVGGLWLAFIGWFIQSAASNVKLQQTIHVSLSGKRARDVMSSKYIVVTPATSLQNLVEQHIARDFQRAFVVMLGDTFLGIVNASDIRAIEPEVRTKTPVTTIMTRVDQMVTVGPDDPLEAAFQKLAASGTYQVAVVESGRLLGMITREDVLGVLELADLFPASSR